MLRHIRELEFYLGVIDNHKHAGSVKVYDLDKLLASESQVRAGFGFHKSFMSSLHKHVVLLKLFSVSQNISYVYQRFGKLNLVIGA